MRFIGFSFVSLWFLRDFRCKVYARVFHGLINKESSLEGGVKDTQGEKNCLNQHEIIDGSHEPCLKIRDSLYMKGIIYLKHADIFFEHFTEIEDSPLH